jgi:hypothetical protein
MFITNSEALDGKKLYPCKSGNLKRFLCEIKNLRFISKSYDEEQQRCTWFFIKGEELDIALDEWKQRGITGDLLFPKNK